MSRFSQTIRKHVHVRLVTCNLLVEPEGFQKFFAFGRRFGLSLRLSLTWTLCETSDVWARSSNSNATTRQIAACVHGFEHAQIIHLRAPQAIAIVNSSMSDREQ
jgi:hypothetical protein